MSRLNPDKLSVEYMEGVNATDPIIPRCYTLTHSDLTAELFLTIGPNFDYDRITNMRDEVLGEWVNRKGEYYFYVYLMVDGEKGMTVVRNYVFHRELPLALEAIREGDSDFFEAHIEFNFVPILVFFQSKNPKYNKVENWGTFSNYETILKE